VRQHPDNPNNGDVDIVIESIQVNGYVNPIIVQEETGFIVAGNTRYAAMLALGQTAIPAIKVRQTDEGAKRYLVADNQTARLARMDESQLATILQELKESDIGIIGTGFDQNSMEDLLLRVSSPDMPDGHGYGGPQPLGIFQVVIEFDNQDDAESAASELHHMYANVRSVAL